MPGNVPNVSSLLHQSYGNGGPRSMISGLGSSQRSIIDAGDATDLLSVIGNGMGCNAPSSSFGSSMVSPNALAQVPGQQFSTSSGNQILSDQQSAQQLEYQNFQQSQQSLQHISVPHDNCHQQQQHYQNIRGVLGGVTQVKLDVTTDRHGRTPQQLQITLRNLGPVKMELQHTQSMRNLPPIKLEPQHSDQSIFVRQQQQHQQHQYLNMSRLSPQAAAAAQMNFLHQQRLLQLHQQQQQLLKNIPQQRSSMQPQFQQQNLALRAPAKPVYEPGMCARRLTHYMHQQKHRPEDNSIGFWRKFVAEYFAPNAKKKWCVSLYGNGRHTTGVFPQDVWHCEMCNKKPGRGFEATVEVLPRLFKIKYESGTLEGLLYVDMPHEYQNSSGQIVLDYAKAIQESVFERLCIVRDGQLRIVFSADLKICSWEFCARHHEELIPRRLLIPQVSQLGNATQKYQASTQNASSNLSLPELQNNCNAFVASARQLAKALEVPLFNDLGYSKRYVRCLQISEVVNSMKDLIDYSQETSIGPMESLAKFPRRTCTTYGVHSQLQEAEQQQQSPQQQLQQTATHKTSNIEAGQPTAVTVASTNGMSSVDNSNLAPVTSSSGTISGLLDQNFMSLRQQHPLNATSPYGGGSSVQIPSPGSSSMVSQPLCSFQSATPSLSENAPQTSQNGASASVSAALSSTSSPNISMQQPTICSDADPKDCLSSVQKILHEMMMSSELGDGGGVGSMGSDMKNVNGLKQTSNNSGLVGNGAAGSTCMSGGRLGQSAMVNGVRAAIGHNSLSMNRRVAMIMSATDQMMNHHHQQQQQQDLGNQLLTGVGAVNGFNNLLFDWKASP